VEVVRRVGIQHQGPAGTGRLFVLCAPSTALPQVGADEGPAPRRVDETMRARSVGEASRGRHAEVDVLGDARGRRRSCGTVAVAVGREERIEWFAFGGPVATAEGGGLAVVTGVSSWVDSRSIRVGRRREHVKEWRRTTSRAALRATGGELVRRARLRP